MNVTFTPAEPQPGQLGVLPGQEFVRWNGSRWVREPRFDGIPLVDALRMDESK